MKRVPLEDVPSQYKTIALQNRKEAKLYDCILTRVKDINPNEDILVFKYYIPCPLCDYLENRGYSYDGIMFGNTQITCNNCGIYYRPVILRRNT